MARDTFHLIALKSAVTSASFLAKLKPLFRSQQIGWVGHVHFWLHEPRDSPEGHYKQGDRVIPWEFLLVGEERLPLEVKEDIEQLWSITAPPIQGAPEIDVKAQSLRGREGPSLPLGWSADDHSQFDAAAPPEGVALTLEESSHTLGSTLSERKKPLKNLMREFGTSHPGPMAVFGLLRYLPPDGRRLYLEGYVPGFTEKLGPLYGNDPYKLGLGVTDYTTKGTEAAPSKGHPLEDVALVWYPSIWHFAKMLDDRTYADLDREFKVPSMWDNPLMCCTEIDLEQG